MDHDRDEIRKVFEEVYPTNVKTKNPEGYAQMFTEDAWWMAPNVPYRRGISDILEGFRGMISDKDIDPHFTTEEVELLGNDKGYIIGNSVATLKFHDNRPSQTVKYQAFWLMKKENDQWKIYRQIWNTIPL